jgi:glycosyltransferase involved in cell wall biosynthesis
MKVILNMNDISVTSEKIELNKKILFVNHAAVLGGAELCLADLAMAYRNSSQVLLFDEGPFCDLLNSQDINVKVIEAPQSLLSVRTSSRLDALKSLPALWWMAKRILEESKGFDVIHSNSQKAFAAAALAHWMGAPPVIWHLRDIITAGHFSGLNRQLAVTLANTQADQVFVNSKATGDAFVEAGGKAELVHLLYDGVSSAPFNQIISEQVSAIRSEIGVSADTPLVGCFSRLSYWKGQHVLLEAVRDLPNVHVLLVGKALFGEDEYVNQLQALSTSPELSGRVHWLGFRNDIPVLMSACDVITHTSTEPEPFGRVIIEGQLSKRPVIATAAGGAQELIDQGKTGRLVPPNSAISLREAIQDLLIHPDKADELAQKGYNVAKTRFSLEALLSNFDSAMENTFK